eukprot:CAMPEP_0178560144 /NCGR_PEP_ID=MMETSP0697-20121206/11338_1 /TAXON_ID=265572 /ORGANISM="Extubocellulus spinifer, Strain CCMP396" /LENGTH=193 /DNA_ID=CAMNT_0020193397 /DNA_START=41 /DNA_END=620 /DNA_ORIENTATION=+
MTPSAEGTPPPTGEEIIPNPTKPATAGGRVLLPSILAGASFVIVVAVARLLLLTDTATSTSTATAPTTADSTIGGSARHSNDYDDKFMYSDPYSTSSSSECTDPTVLIHVLTMDGRRRSAACLLDGLLGSRYGCAPIDLHVSVDALPISKYSDIENDGEEERARYDEALAVAMELAGGDGDGDGNGNGNGNGN